MAKGNKIQTDYINWVVTLNASQAQKEIHNVTESTRELEKQNKEFRKQMGELDNSSSDYKKRLDELNQKITANNKIISENKEKQKLLTRQLDKSQMTANQLAKEMRNLQRELRNTSKATDPKRYKELEQELERTAKAYRNAVSSSKSFGEKLKDISKPIEAVKGALWNVGQSILSTFANAFKNAFNVIADFEAQQSKLAAIMQSTKEGIADMTEQARQLGATTSYTAGEVTSLQVELAKLGFLKEDIKAMTPEVLKFARAVDTDLGSAAALTGAALRIFGMNADETGRAVSAMAIGTTSSALSFSYLENALSTVGPVANSFGFTLEETTALLGQLANSGFDASSAATAIRNLMLNMADSSGKLAKALGQPVHNLDDLVAGLQKLQAEGINLAEALELSDKRSVAAFQTFLNGADNIKTLRDNVTDCQGAFDQMSEEMGDNVRGSLAILSSTIEGLILRLYDSRGILKLLVDAITKVFEAIGWVIDNIGTFLKWLTPAIVSVTAFKVALLASEAAAKLKTKAMIADTVATGTATKANNIFSVAVGKASAGIKKLFALIKAHPLATFLSAVSLVATAVALWTSKSEEAADAQAKVNKITAEAEAEGAKEKAMLDNLYKATQNQTLAIEQRRIAAEMLQKKYPEWFANLTTEEILAGKAADAYERLQKQIIGAAKAHAYNKRLEQLAEEDYEDEKQEEEDRKWLDENQSKYDRLEARSQDEKNLEMVAGYVNGVKIGGSNLDKNTKFKQEYAKRSARYESTRTRRKTRGEEQNLLVDKITAVEAVTPTTPTKPTTTGNRYADPKKTGNTHKESPAQKALKELQAEHDARMAQIEANGREEQQLETEINIEKAREAERFAQERIAKAEELAAATSASDEKELTRLKEMKAKGEADLTKALDDIEDAVVAREQDNRDRRLQLETTYYQQQADTLERALLSQDITQQQHDAYMMEVNEAHHQQLLQIHRDYADNLAEIDIYSNDRREQLQRQAADTIRQSEMQLLRDRAAIAEKTRQLTDTPIGLSGIKAAYQRQREETAKAYDAQITIAARAGMQTVELARHKQQALINIDYEYQQQLYGIQQQVGTTWAGEYQNQLSQYQHMLDQQLISEQQFQKLRLQLQMANTKKYFDYYSNLSASMVESIQQAEIDQVEAKYDVLIRDAENNGEDTTALEEEKEAKKLDIQKKYADMNFAIKCSQIIADTAVSIMKAYADLGPIAGSVAAALLAVTGAAQLVSAKAERDKIKNLNAKSSSAQGSATERVVSGYAEGGYTGPGPRYEVAGVVHRGEYVVPQPIMSLPMVADAVSTIEAIRRSRAGAAPHVMPGYADGGYVATPPHSEPQTRELLAAAVELRRAVKSVRNIRSYVVYQDLERSRDLINQARAPFTRS